MPSAGRFGAVMFMRKIRIALLVLTPLCWATEAVGLTIASGGEARVRIVLAREATEAESTAARELADYLSRITGASFRAVSEAEDDGETPAILVGPTGHSRRLGPDPLSLGEEEWILRTDGERLLLYGGRPRGTLYAVYRFLESHVGVRWWTPFEEHVPRLADLAVADLDERGKPALVYRDISVENGPAVFRARSRLNGHFSRLSAAYGGSQSYGPPHQVHTFYLYVSPEEYYDSHPEYFSEIGGLRYGGQAQLCLTNPELLEIVVAQMSREIELSRDGALARGTDPPVLFNFSQNDWDRPCECERCSAKARREGSQSGPLIDFVNRLAREIGPRYPDVWIDTLAYGYTLDAPNNLRVEDNVVVRISGLHQRDFTRPITDPTNHEYAAAVEDWSARTAHLRVWDYPVVFGNAGEFPLPNLRALSQDFRFFLDHGVEGVFVEAAFPIAADLRDLKLWVIAKILEDPRRDIGRLLVEFTRGYYGRAGEEIRAYLKRLEKAAARRSSVVGYRAKPSAYTYLDARFFRRAHRIFDRAEREVEGDPELLRRVRHARLSLDRATLVLWDAAAGSRLALDEIVRRYRDTWRDQIELRMLESERSAALEEVEREIAYWSERHDR